MILNDSDPRYSIAIQNKSNDDVPRLLERFDYRLTDKDQVALAEVGPGKKHDPEKCSTRELENIQERMLDNLDKSKAYDFLTPYPEVSYIYDKKKDYCPRFVISFYADTPGFSKFVMILLPMFLVSFLAILNVVNDFDKRDVDEDGEQIGGEDPSSHLQVTSALTLTIVFVLPLLLEDHDNRNQLFTRENISIMVFFTGLVLASVPRALSISIRGNEQILGVVLMGASALFLPLFNSVDYFRIKRKITKRSNEQTKDLLFLMTDCHENWQESKGLGDFFTVGEYVKGEKKYNDRVYQIYDCDLDSEGIAKKIWWATPSQSSKRRRDSVMSNKK